MTTFEVELIAQQTAKSCWAASIAMIQSWAQQASFDPGILADIPGFQQAYERNGLDLTTAQTALQAWGLVVEPPQDYTGEGFLALLDQFGPLFIAANVGTEQHVANHARVVTGFDLDQNLVYINDPWGANMPSFVPSNAGQQYTMTYDALLDQMDSLARAVYNDVERRDPANQLANLAFIAHLLQRPANV